MSAVFQYDQQAAIDASSAGGEYLTESSVERGFITQAKWVRAGTGTLGLELSFESEKGQKVNFLTMYYQKHDGSRIDVGHGQINSIMGVTGTQQLSQVQQGQDTVAPELKGRPIALALERHNYTKGNGDPGFKFVIKCIMSANSWLTVAENASGSGPQSKDYWAGRFAENPRGVNDTPMASQSGGFQQSAPASAAPYDDFDDDIPF